MIDVVRLLKRIKNTDSFEWSAVTWSDAPPTLTSSPFISEAARMRADDIAREQLGYIFQAREYRGDELPSAGDTLTIENVQHAVDNLTNNNGGGGGGGGNILGGGGGGYQNARVTLADQVRRALHPNHLFGGIDNAVS